MTQQSPSSSPVLKHNCKAKTVAFVEKTGEKKTEIVVEEVKSKIEAFEN